MDARVYFDLTDAILAAATPVALAQIESRIQATEMHPFERKALARVLRSRAEALDTECAIAASQAARRAGSRLSVT